MTSRSLKQHLTTALAALAAGVCASSASAQCTGFALSSSTGASITPGIDDIGNHGDDVVSTGVALPFPVNMYGVSYNSVNISSNGNVQFATTSNSYSNSCLPNSLLGVAIVAHWDDQRTDGTAGEGIYTSTTGSAPNRVFNIEWRVRYFSGGGTANYEVRFFEDGSHFEVIYGAMGQGGTSATVGVQHTVFPHLQYSCNASTLTSGLKLSFTCTNDPIPPQGSPSASPSNATACGPGSTSLLSVLVTPGFNPTSTGLGVSANLSSINGASSQPFYDDGTHGDATAGDSRFSFLATINSSVTPGNKTMPYTVTDSQNRSATGNIALSVAACPTFGPDVYVARLTDCAYWGVVGSVSAYSVGTDACNAGDTPVSWYASINQHPVIAQNMFRLKDGRFEQLGQSWLKHGFSSTNSGTCGTCQSPPDGGQQLGVSCSDAYGSGLNGGQGNLGPRSQVNATTGVYPYPFTAAAAPATIGRRLQVYTTDVDPALNPGATYFVDCHYVTSDDAQWNNGTLPAVNGLNNATYQQVSISSTTASPALLGSPVQMSPGIQAWKDMDPSVTLKTADYVDTSLSPVGIVARFWVAGKATDNGNGTWHYEYAVYNHNADRDGGSFSIPRAPAAVISNVGFHGVFAHSGEPYPNSAASPDNWVSAVSSGTVTWTTPEAYQAPGDTGNSLRWGTMYNFRFDANIAPSIGNATIGLYKPGTPTSIEALGLPVPGNPCPADTDNGTATGTPDGGVDISDLLYFLGRFEAGDATHADLDNGSGTGTPDGGVDISDLLFFLAHFEAGC